MNVIKEAALAAFMSGYQRGFDSAWEEAVKIGEEVKPLSFSPGPLYNAGYSAAIRDYLEAIRDIKE